MDKIGIIVVILPKGRVNGCVFYRQVAPHLELHNHGFNILFTDNLEEMSDEKISQYHIVQRHKGYDSPKQHERIKKLGLTTVIDFDDYWKLPKNHILHNDYKRKGTTQKFIEMLKRYDYVTASTPLLADQIRRFNENVEVFENAVDPTIPMWHDDFVPDRYVRFGYFGGSTHWPDVKLLKGTPEELWRTEKGKYKLFLFGHTRGSISQNYLDIFTSYGRIKEPVLAFPVAPVMHSPERPSYVRYYNFVDAVLVPLVDNKFNNLKSELKLVEAGIFRKPVIVSDVWPYRYVANENNALLVRKPDDWARHMRTLIHEPELRKELGENLFKTIKDRYDLRVVNKKRAEFYRKIVKKL